MLGTAFIHRVCIVKLALLFPDGAAVAQLTVNQRVVGSNPTRGARNLKPGEAILRVFLSDEATSSIAAPLRNFRFFK